ncbi:hypothetical protein I5Q34_34090 [Streptomyces sp. AV19]|uniref:hypothetical protein n=1 Tax=Streptomyces sp. AV19 TaxID=2793068 RepID=UPI0018FEB912|nr:hypothetical protein [Streptomyces sp. AV19]MBH1939232.1 hypothetical protein [Streptomyces sp. AV19]MDG4537186.1 hypothetical protein [Streptomyces sp. AV19]
MISINGRSVLSRQDIHARYGYATSTLERWWNDRNWNGHPNAHRIGQTLYWDAKEWDRWDRRRLHPERDGLADRAQLCNTHGISTSTFDRLWHARETNGHPRAVPHPGPRLYWRATEYARWIKRHRPADGQPRRGRRTGTRDENAHPYQGDPRLNRARQALADHPDATTAALARILHEGAGADTAPYTWARIIKAARNHPRDEGTS